MDYDDGTHDHSFINIISENLYSQVDSEVNKFLVLEDIFDHHSDGTAIAVADGFIIIRCCNKKPKKTTHGRELLTQKK